MNGCAWLATRGEGPAEVLSADGERTLCRLARGGRHGAGESCIAVVPEGDSPAQEVVRRLAHEYELRDQLDRAWALRPLELVPEGGRPILVLEDSGGEPLERMLGEPMAPGHFLPIAIAITAALRRLHEQGLVHKDIKPAHVFVDAAGAVRLTGFGIASRLPRERQPPEAPEVIAGTLAYMAPEQTGRMNRSIDSRSDLYSLGVTFYQMLTGVLPFTASDPMGWVHCHVARRPTPPGERLAVPAVFSSLVMKLLDKTAEGRYQTAAGVESDLRRCMTEWLTAGRVGDFAVGQHDMPDRLLIPEKLYGREHEVETLLGGFQRVRDGGSAELVLVSGHSGIGKSSVVNELHKVLPASAFFASGKFEQYKRDIPYATLTQAFRNLARRLLAKSDGDLAPWREALSAAVGPHGRLITALVPELALIIGEQPLVAELPPQDAQRRFHAVFRRFIGVFARAEHPLALFVDDLQWIDGATLDLLEDLLVRADLRHVLLVGSYRSNEVGPDHPLARKLEAIEAAGGRIASVTLAPLARQHLTQLIADALRCGTERAAPLADLVHEKTGGNPFFAVHFMSSLADEGLLGFDHEAGGWSWDLPGIEAKGYTDNVVDIMLAKLTRVPPSTHEALQLLACLGNQADAATLAVVLERSTEELQGALWPAVRQELIERVAGGYRFLHDRVQEAAYSTIDRDARAAVHLRIGRLLLSHAEGDKLQDSVFEIVSQLNRGSGLMDSPEERVRLAQLNLLAGQRAKASTAYGSALAYFAAGSALLPAAGWGQWHELAFELETHRAECEFLLGAFATAEPRLATLSAHAADTIERAAVACLRVDLYITLGRPGDAIDAGLEYLRGLGGEWPAMPTLAVARQEYERIRSMLGERPVEDLLELPLMQDRASLATLDVLTKLQVPNLYTDANLLSVIICRAVNLSLERGNSDGSCVAYVMLGMIAGPYFGDHERGFRFGQLGQALLDKRGFQRFRARTSLCFGSLVVPWARHARTGRDFLRHAFDTANSIGDLTFAAYSCNHLNTNRLACGDVLADVQREAEKGLEFARGARFGLVVDIITVQLQLVRMLRGFTRVFGSLDEEGFDEREFEQRLSAGPGTQLLECWYCVRKLQARVFARDWAGALAAAARARQRLWTSPSHLEVAEHSFFSALAHAGAWEGEPAAIRLEHLEAVRGHHGQVGAWARYCPDNFEHRAALLGAEIARMEGRELDAERLYELAIRSARNHRFVHDEGLACECAARFHAARDFHDISRMYLRSARRAYARWGAAGKVKQLDEAHPGLREEERPSPSSTTIGTPVEHLDLATVIKVSQAVSGEMVLEKMLETLMLTALEHAGAERGLLALAHTGELRVAAEATTTHDRAAVDLRDQALTDAAVPQSVFLYAMRTRESVMLDDAGARGPFSDDPYFARHPTRSVLCLPLLKQGKVMGVLYLENNLAARVFVPTRLATLKLLASEAAISLENSRLYRDLAAREARIRRLVDANIIGIFIWDLRGSILDANDAFIRMLGYEREDLVAGRLRWTELTPAEWRAQDEQNVPQLRSAGTLHAYEKEYLRKDGSRVPVLVGAAMYEESRNQGVAFVLDLTERKRSEREARDSERRLHEMEMRLVDANRVATAGHLSAAIAHELNQPLAGMVSNASTCLRRLTADPPNVDGALGPLRRMIRDATRASDVIHRLRALFAHEDTAAEWVDLNEAAREVIALSSTSLQKDRVTLRCEWAEGLPPVVGDRVQLQQVIMNLLRNAVDAVRDVNGRARLVAIRTCLDDGGGVRLTVQDAGVGLSGNGTDKLFEAFYTTKKGGMGIGLSVSRSIIARHRGRLWAELNDGPGASFSFSIPAGPTAGRHDAG